MGPGAPTDQQAGEGDCVDGEGLPLEAEAHHARAGDPVRQGESQKKHR